MSTAVASALNTTPTRRMACGVVRPPARRRRDDRDRAEGNGERRHRHHRRSRPRRRPAPPPRPSRPRDAEEVRAGERVLQDRLQRRAGGGGPRPRPRRAPRGRRAEEDQVIRRRGAARPERTEQARVRPEQSRRDDRDGSKSAISAVVTTNRRGQVRRANGPRARQAEHPGEWRGERARRLTDARPRSQERGVRERRTRPSRTAERWEAGEQRTAARPLPWPRPRSPPRAPPRPRG